MKRFIGFIFSGFFFVLTGMCYGQNHVGIILSGQEKDCEVTHNGKVSPCGSQKLVYLGDLIMKKPSTKLLRIKWAPFVSPKEKSETVLEVTLRQPEKLSGNRLVSGLKQYVDDFIKPTEYGAVALVTRARGKKMLWPSQATLLPDMPLQVAEAQENFKSVVLADGTGQKVYEKSIKGKGPIILLPAELGIKPSERYSLTIQKEGSQRKMEINLPDKEIQEEILQGLADIDSQKGSPSEKVINKAVYFQYLSDAYPSKIDLYLVGYHLLQDHSALFAKDQEDLLQKLDQRYTQHCRKK